MQLRRLGPAHTAGDTVVHIPHARTVFAGDLLFTGVTPNSWSGSVASWRAALDEIAALDPDVIVPGHGPLSTIDDLVQLDRYWGWLDDAARRELAAGASIDETARRIVLSDAFRAEPWSRWACPERTVLNVAIIDRERRGVATAIGHGERPRLMWKVARLAATLADAATD